MLRRRLSHLVTRGKKSSTLGFVRPRGKPKYVKGSDPIKQPNTCAKAFALSSDILMGTNSDFE